MKLKPLVLVVGLVLGLAVIAWGWQTIKQKKSVRTRNNLLAEVPLENVVQVVVISEDSRVHVERVEDGWQVREQNNYPADTLKLRGLFDSINGLQLDREVGSGEKILRSFNLILPPDILAEEAGEVEETEETEAAETKDTEDTEAAETKDKESSDADTDVADAGPWLGKQLRLLNENGTPLFILTLGEERENRTNARSFAGNYLRLGTEETVWLTGSQLFLSDSPLDWIKRRLFPKRGELTAIQLGRKNKVIYRLEKETVASPWQVKGVVGSPDTRIVSELVNDIKDWEIADLDELPVPRSLGTGRQRILTLDFINGLSYKIEYNEKASKVHNTQHPIRISASVTEKAGTVARRLADQVNNIGYTVLLERRYIQRLPEGLDEFLIRKPEELPSVEK